MRHAQSGALSCSHGRMRHHATWSQTQHRQCSQERVAIDSDYVRWRMRRMRAIRAEIRGIRDQRLHRITGCCPERATAFSCCIGAAWLERECKEGPGSASRLAVALAHAGPRDHRQHPSEHDKEGIRRERQLGGTVVLSAYRPAADAVGACPVHGRALR